MSSNAAATTLVDCVQERVAPTPGTGIFTGTATISVINKLRIAYAAKLNVLRFVAICSIVWGHSLLGWESLKVAGRTLSYMQTIIIETGRLGTVIFFIISGYFLSDRIKQYSIGSYLKHRFKSVIVPWFIFVFICVALQALQIYSPMQLVTIPVKTTWPVIATLLSSSIFYAAYWFIPVSILSACLLVLFKKYIQSIILGGSLAVITLFYCVNLYYGWIDVNHTKSLVGYTFFMWLGLWFKQNITLVDSFINKLRWHHLIPILLVLFTVSCIEGTLLRNLGCKDPFASIRLSNILLSAAIFVAFLKHKSIYRVKKLKPEKYVYGVYLVHSIILLEVMPMVLRMLQEYNVTDNIILFLLVQFAFYAVIIFSSYAASVLIKHSRLHFLIGR